MSDDVASERTTPHRKTAAAEAEPEYVGAHSNPVEDECVQWSGNPPEPCGRQATHTVVMYDGELHEVASCDKCGEPGDVEDFDRRWSG